jgi:outer membrane protein TolC
VEWFGKGTITLALTMATWAVGLVQPAPCQESQSESDRRLSTIDLLQVSPGFDLEDPSTARSASTPIHLALPTSLEETIEAAFPSDESVTLTRPWWSHALAMEADPSDEPSVPRPRSTVDSAAFVGRGWELDQLIWLAVEHSPYIKAVLVEPQILQSRAMQAAGQFDPSAFVDSIFHDTSDPVGNTLTTGNASRLNDHVWDSRSGIRAKNFRGGQAEFSQQFLFKDSNSNFFVPSNQADTKMFLRYTQPLMRGRGEAYNKSSIVIASLKANQNSYEVSANIQAHVFQITSAYWELYVARASYAQIEFGLRRLSRLKQKLAGRVDLDGLRSQLMRADAAIARQEANLARALSQIRSSEAKLRAAVAAPELRDRSLGDVIPATPTADWRSAVSTQDELNQALDFHPDIQAIRSELKATRVQLQVAEHELRPTLDLVLEGYVRGLNGAYDAAQSFGDQFSEGAPSYSAGLSYVRPYNNTTARAILRERRLELRRQLLQLDNTLLTVSAEVESAIASLDAAYQQLESAVRSTMATHVELEYLTARWSNAFLDNTSTSLLLDQLLNAEVQLIQAENTWARAQADHMLTTARLRLATGTLLPLISPAGEDAFE